jgi:selenocysteine lyase/cysteine desulfurase
LSFINFNNAGSSFVTKKTSEVIKQFFSQESIYGGYYAEEKFRKKIDEFYTNTSRLINCNCDEISFVPNTTYAWNFLINSINLEKTDNVILFDNEYGSNYMSLLKKKIKIKICSLKDGVFSEKELLQKVDNKTRFISLCHIASQSGETIDVNKLGKFINKKFPKVLFIIDACQSIGQIKIDVKKNFCSALVCSGRKYLRGPRGTGFIYLNKKLNKKIHPSIIDLKNYIVENKKLKITSYKRIFEVFEYSPALKLGLSNSINEINNYGMKKIEKKNKSLSEYFRRELSDYSNIKFYENLNKLSGINTLSIKNKSSQNIHSYLLKKKILTSISTYQTSTNYFKKKKIKYVLRISFHYYNQIKEIDFLVKCLIDLTKNK